MPRLPFAVLTAALLLAASGASAFEVQKMQTNSDGSAKFNDPDDATQGMANNLSGGNSSGTMNLFGGRMSLQSSGGSSGFSPANQDRFMGGPDSISRAYVAPR